MAYGGIMESNILENTVRQRLDAFYQQRIEKLRSLKLRDVIGCSPNIFWLIDSEGASDIIARLIEEYLSSFEESWSTSIQDSEFCFNAILIRQNMTNQKFLYEEQLCNARNRITLKFIDKYCTPNYAIDWEKLIHFNSGKD